MAMQHDSDPVFRKIIVPWYDANILCVCAAVATMPITAFALRGLNIAFQFTDHPSFTGLPLTLLGMSLFVFFSLVARLLRRRFSR